MTAIHSNNDVSYSGHVKIGMCVQCQQGVQPTVLGGRDSFNASPAADVSLQKATDLAQPVIQSNGAISQLLEQSAQWNELLQEKYLPQISVLTGASFQRGGQPTDAGRLFIDLVRSSMIHHEHWHLVMDHLMKKILKDGDTDEDQKCSWENTLHLYAQMASLLVEGAVSSKHLELFLQYLCKKQIAEISSTKGYDVLSMFNRQEFDKRVVCSVMQAHFFQKIARWRT